MILLKEGVVISNLGDAMILEPALAADRIWAEQNWGDVIITSGIEGNHVTHSKHYIGLALDIRSPANPTMAAQALQGLLPNWKVLLEADHIHIQRV